jgi:hypothetical protein
MVETLVVYLIVASAAGWTAWSMVLRGWLARRRATRPLTGKAPTGCGPDCNCGS